jgi:hypothetical protein
MTTRGEIGTVRECRMGGVRLVDSGMVDDGFVILLIFGFLEHKQVQIF